MALRPAKPSKWVAIISIDMAVFIGIDIILRLLPMNAWQMGGLFALATALFCHALYNALRLLCPTRSNLRKIALIPVVILMALISIPTVTTQWNKDHGNQAVLSQPVPPQSVVNSGNNSTIIQAGNAATVTTNVTYGLSREEMEQMLKTRFDTPDQAAELAKEFPAGYALVGAIGGGNLVWLPRLKTVQFSADWDKMTITRGPRPTDLNLNLPDFYIQRQSEVGLRFTGCTIMFQHMQQGVAMRDPVLWYFYLKPLDIDKNMFVIGFK